MFHHIHPHVSRPHATSDDHHQLRNGSSSRSSSSAGIYFHAYDGGGAPVCMMAPPTASMSTAGIDGHRCGASRGYSSKQHDVSRYDQWEMREDDIDDIVDDDGVGYDDDDEDDDEEDEPMDILYEQEVFDEGHHRRRGSVGDIHSRAHIMVGQQHQQHYHRHNNFHRHHSEPISLSSTSPAAAASTLDLQISTSSDHLMALLQREANIYSEPLPIRYYPTEFVEEVTSSSISLDDKKTTTPTIGPWRKRIASWMFDVVDHFQYDRNVVSIALWYIDRYVGHLLVEEERNQRRAGGSGTESVSQPIKRRHFQLIAVTSLYLAIKVHGELKENDPVSGEEYDVVASLVHEVDGRAFLGKSIAKDGKMDVDDEEDGHNHEEIDDDLRAVSQKINDLKRRHRMGRWSSRLSHFGLPLVGVYPSAISSDSRINSSVMMQSSMSGTTKVPKVPAAAHSMLPYKPRKRGMLSGPLRIHSFVELSRGLFTSKDITDTEKKILLSMNYVVNPPTSRRFVGELLRSVALGYCRSTGHSSIATKETLESAAERMFGFNLKEILGNILSNACQQIESATSKPTLSIGCLPSIVAYGAVLNALDDEFDKIASCTASPQLEDFQRHYQRYSRAQSPSSHGASSSNIQTKKEQLLDVWKEEFLVMVFRATNGFLSPDSDDILKVRELLLDPVKSTAISPSPETSSPSNEENKQEGTKKRSPRSPRSIIASSVLSRNVSLFASQSSTSSLSDSARLLSPYTSMGHSSAFSGEGSCIRPASIRSKSGGAVATASQPHRAYYKQMSEPITMHDNSTGKYARAQTPDVSNYLNELTRQRMRSNHDCLNEELFELEGEEEIIANWIGKSGQRSNY
ncbi:hypothetical protein ACHAWU_002043 [Discostella pseudostelligera]|uniref:Cyclin N-terminal domain-containing protein n=1 Tax=Discostella pseudostelligera TaxID=259834 RepID=A0ABD3M692_9STRA